METTGTVYEQNNFFRWLVGQDKISDEKQANDTIESLNSLNERVWSKIGHNLKISLLNPDEPPFVFDFNPFPWIKECIENNDKYLLRDIITLYSSILRRLLEKVNLDPEVIELAICNEEKLKFNEIIVGKYTWSEAVLEAYHKFEKSLPLPSRTMVIKWNLAWKSYIDFLNLYFPGFDLYSEISDLISKYRNQYDPYGTDSRIRDLEKMERVRENKEAKRWAREMIDENINEITAFMLMHQPNLKSTSIGISKYDAIDWLWKDKCCVVSECFDPTVNSFGKSIISIVKNNPHLSNLDKEILIIVCAERDYDIKNIENENFTLEIFGTTNLNKCVIKDSVRNGEGIYRIEICYR